MQVFRCPYCGARDETEFRYLTEFGKVRPQGGPSCDAGEWAQYLYSRSNRKGLNSEVWRHLTCGESFVMERNTVTHEVTWTRSLRRSGEATDVAAAAGARELGSS